MDKVTRRKALATIAAAPATVTAISPALSKVYRTGAVDIDDQLQELALRFRNDAMAIDPTIKGAWIGHDFTIDGRASAVMSIYLERDNSPFVRRHKAPTA